MLKAILSRSVMVIAVSTSVCAQAQICSSPAIWHGGSQPMLTGTTCGQETNNGGGFCGGTFDAPGPAFVMQATFAPVGMYTQFSVSNASGFTPAIYVTSTCGQNGACVATGDGQNPVPNTAVPDNGTFYIIVTAASFDQIGACGTFGIVSDGSFPVELQSFSVR